MSSFAMARPLVKDREALAWTRNHEHHLVVARPVGSGKDAGKVTLTARPLDLFTNPHGIAAGNDGPGRRTSRLH